MKIPAFRPLFASLAILLSPGVLGPWLQLTHFCPTRDAAAFEHGFAAAMHHHQDQSHPREQGHQGHGCNCVGACHTAAATVVPLLGRLIPKLITIAPASSLVAAAAVQPVRPAHQLPFATAPPAIA